MRWSRLALITLVATAPLGAAQRTTINPVDLDYRYNFEQINDGASYRTGADPAIVNHRGTYYLFQTLADGYWRSTDLRQWRFVTPSRWPMHSIVAPALWSDGEKIVIQPSMMEPGSVLMSSDPDHGRIDFLAREMPPLPGSVNKDPKDMKPGEVPPGPWDPALFKDDDGQWYLYWGSSNIFPMYGQKIGFADGRMSYQTRAEPMLSLHPDVHGWERFGQDHCACWSPGRPSPSYMEGAWMTKVGGTYYLQYGAPGTEFNAYANGVYTASSPLGPFTYAPYNPVAYRPGGYAEGAGHGSTFRDNHGNWWNSGTSWIGYNWGMERRVVIHPVRFYPDGQMSASTRFGDWPRLVPAGKVDDPDRLFPGWMLLSYRKRVTASSTLAGFGTAAVSDEDPRSFWVAARNRPGETLTMDLGQVATLRAVQVNFADYKSGRFADAPDIYTEFRLDSSPDGRRWTPLARTEAPRRDRPNAYFELPRPVRARFVRYVHGHVGGKNLAIAELRLFGAAPGRAPSAPSNVAAERHADDRDATIRWPRVAGATGYNIRFGIRPDRLTLTHQLWADELGAGASLAKELRSLNHGVPYYAAVEAFNETGVGPLSAVVPVR
ncbi:coagulation factor 5/8 type domain protein [Sphingomonas ginkgonis]|uniref:Coagulation factor 5/8 type domain protein n=1 Tax=Sphingomonas ginkgonis TaxID=2315330 RepID=A0A3R9YKX8_9SPHN|nr:family 43 glycosylhydrolase [Sphingomonas ginkgonis]RST29855.1 coagulation factor 5/8 type domain protein [Sphingomonas ginkgonis]